MRQMLSFINLVFHPLIVLSFLVIVLLHLLGIRPVEVDLTAALSAPSLGFPLGTDNLGRDLLGRISEAVGGSVLVVWVGVILGQALGAGAATLFLTRQKTSVFSTVLAPCGRFLGSFVVSVPAGILAFALAVWTEVYSVTLVACVLAVVFFVSTAFQVGGLWLESSKLAWWQAHEAMGGSALARIWRCGFLGLWRDDLSLSLVQGLKVGVTIEASMSWLGFGVQEPRASFGNMIAAHFETWLRGNFSVLIVIVCALWLVAQVPESFRQVVLMIQRRSGMTRVR